MLTSQPVACSSDETAAPNCAGGDTESRDCRQGNLGEVWTLQAKWYVVRGKWLDFEFAFETEGLGSSSNGIEELKQ